ncbi:MAG TPA: hypothetical protein ENG95_04165 [Nitrospirae bacterium]|nr:hypothetical protein BMS3Abin10_01964 [bacterium BMS3Abin10]GBE38181.1 hypothetical protein BMS3Bbin08_00784 [bacterium BMS3Bbin08]HDH01077.1 hypothetical protein [Nitrospirota bacterium]HDH51045.1 hypothetical protein [Nitrospirota bacterium]HDO25820.1 hypothetical protein [Nitrospirota bacterium]
MRILLIGNFSPLCEEEPLHNFTLLNLLKRDGHECRAINIGDTRSKDERIVNAGSYFDFITKLISLGLRCKVIHFLTKGYVRPGLMKLMTTVFLGRLFRAKIIITLHSELFSIFGRLRSKMGGQQLLYFSFSLADRIICSDRHTFDVALTHHRAKEKFIIIPSFILLPEEISEKDTIRLRNLENKNRIIVFAGVSYPSLLFDILNDLLANYLDPGTGLAVCVSREDSVKLQHVIKEASGERAGNIVFIEPDDPRLLTLALTRADLMLRTLSCDARILFKDIAFSIKRPAHGKRYLYFPVSVSFINEGNVMDLCARIMKNLIEEPAEALMPSEEDFYEKIKDIYPV